MQKNNTTKNDIIISNSLVESRYNLGLVEQKIINILISKIDYQDDDLTYYRLKTDDFIEIFTNSRDYKQKMIKALDNLRNTDIIINTENNTVLTTSWLASAEYKSSVVEIEFSRKLKPYLIQLKKCFTRYNLAPILKFQCKYSIRIYQLAKQYKKIGSRTFKIDDFQAIIGANYSRLSDIRKRILEPALDEINNTAECDINVSYECEKEVRKVVAITFFVSQKYKKTVTQNQENEEINITQNQENNRILNEKINETSNTINEENEEKKITEDELFDMIDKVRNIINEKLTTADIKSILAASNYDYDCVERNYILSIEQTKIHNLTAYLISACKSDYEKNSSRISKKNKKKEPANAFHNFDQQDYDFDEINKVILERQWS